MKARELKNNMLVYLVGKVIEIKGNDVRVVVNAEPDGIRTYWIKRQYLKKVELLDDGGWTGFGRWSDVPTPVSETPTSAPNPNRLGGISNGWDKINIKLGQKTESLVRKDAAIHDVDNLIILLLSRVIRADDEVLSRTVAPLHGVRYGNKVGHAQNALNTLTVLYAIEDIMIPVQLVLHHLESNQYKGDDMMKTELQQVCSNIMDMIARDYTKLKEGHEL